MNLDNWLYLGIGTGIGLLGGWLSARLLTPTSPEAQIQDIPLLLQEQVKQSQLAYQMAQEMGQFKAGFLARITHELRSPLNGLIGLHQLILNDLCENPAEEREFVEQAYERSLKLLKMIDEILSVSRTEHGTNKLSLQPIQLTQVLHEVHKLTYMLAANRNYPFTVSLPKAEIYVLADIHWFRQVLVNLVDTTISQMEEGSICIATSIVSTNNAVYIWLDVPTHAVISSEPVDLIASEQITNQENTDLSPGMKLLLNQKLLAVMGGKLEILPSPTTDATRLQISMPLAIPEVEFLQPQVNPD
ncbi:HAMP domain-containing histidine kinase [Anabaena cylindrica FACHB-243]|uniref:histidine kinase n=1 Tax=Anabaena cylindrica (strain ATCC 27899 / PCC 7122) TaxID=272123 RepID=K9ZDV4_ANACC|nr:MULTISPECIES: HAMP domain-containing sensor histidine kinase [Anabaena]AFZ56924.1 histidine kinase [Anabaena cylindrica PCC 7122]MBD2418410.1 HAMP domain-containing histidine kinase [Anabaena cylindrica FACHB-243]MBY5284357.1 HAMP domain-containing histidine kinase [Anabaena sp. CCAP 1446/1C]MBY5307632.1 HAMP domain-containing histidine kinase [Anabaena sp. CCAP 1446/1C]MCM2409407.1 HAMP domain-containing histidine kinase [Anabaena sp. CCAP 1446/1C]